ncbi:MAG: PRC-barrel domain-containing protein [Hyphomicrobium sp.]
MKTKTMVLALIATIAASGLPAAADEAFIPAQQLTEYLAKDRLIGAKVHDKDGKIVADIEDLIINNDDKVVGVVMGVGGFMGLWEKKVAVHASALQLEVTDGKMHVTMAAASKETFDAAPAYQRATPKKGLMQRAIEKSQELKDKSTETAKEAYDKAKENAGPAIEAAKKKASEALEQAKGAAKSAVESAKDAAEPAPAPAPAPTP